jgi:hypothetical protein
MGFSLTSAENARQRVLLRQLMLAQKPSGVRSAPPYVITVDRFCMSYAPMMSATRLAAGGESA